MRYKVGDKVRVKEDLEVGKLYGVCYFFSDMDLLKGKIVTIEHTYEDKYLIKGSNHYWTDEMFEDVDNQIKTLKDLCENDIITLRNRDKLVVLHDEAIVDVATCSSNNITSTDDFKNDLTCSYNSKYDIIKVERPVGYETVYAREKKRMTVAQICKELGYDVEIVENE